MPDRTPRRDQQRRIPNNMKSLLIGWLAAQGIALANDASEQSVFDAFQNWVKSQGGNITALGNDKSTLSTKVTALENDKTTLTAKVTALENDKTQLATKVTALENDAKAQRTARVEAIVDLAIAKGKLAVAERAGKITEIFALANDKLEGGIKTLLGSAAGCKPRELVNLLAADHHNPSAARAFLTAILSVKTPAHASLQVLADMDDRIEQATRDLSVLLGVPVVGWITTTLLPVTPIYFSPTQTANAPCA